MSRVGPPAPCLACFLNGDKVDDGKADSNEVRMGRVPPAATTACTSTSAARTRAYLRVQFEMQKALAHFATLRALFVASKYEMTGRPSGPIVIELYCPT